jgi:hypothetical protein
MQHEWRDEKSVENSSCKTKCNASLIRLRRRRKANITISTERAVCEGVDWIHLFS